MLWKSYTFLLLIILITAAAGAQTYRIEGYIKEAGTRVSIPGVEVKIEDWKQSTTSGNDGYFDIQVEQNVQPALGIYPSVPQNFVLTVQAPGYKPFQENFVWAAGRTTTVVAVYLERSEFYQEWSSIVRDRRSIDNIARGSHQISQREALELPGTYGDPVKAIENFPGMGRVLLSQGGLWVRGASPEETSFLVDGYEVPDLYHFTGSTSVINIPFVDSVELIPSVPSARYGRFTGGLVNLQTKKLPTDAFHGVAKMDVVDGGIYIGAPLRKDMAVGVSARRSWLDVVRNIQRFRGGTGDSILLVPTYWDYQIKLDWDTAPGHELTLFLFGSGDREEYVADGAGLIAPYSKDHNSDFHRAALRYSHSLGSGWSNHIDIAGGFYRRNFSEMIDVRTLSHKTWDLQLRDEVRWREGADRFYFGLNALFKQDQMGFGGRYATTSTPSYPEDPTLSTSLMEDVMLMQNNVALYVEGTTQPDPHIQFTPGMRVEAYWFDNNPVIQWEPRMVTRLNFSQGQYGTAMQGGIGLVSRAASVEERARASTMGVTLPVQQALHSQVSLEQNLGERVSFRSTVYSIWRTQQNEKVAGFPEVDVGQTSLYLGAASQSIGYEALLRVAADSKAYAWLTYSLARHTRLPGPSTPYTYAYASPVDVTHMLGVVGQVETVWNIRLGARYRIATGMPYQPVVGGIFDSHNAEYYPQRGAISSERYPVFHALDVRVDWPFVFKYFELDVYADLINILNLRAQEDTTYQYDFEKNSPKLGLPTIPAVGVKLSF